MHANLLSMSFKYTQKANVKIQHVKLSWLKHTHLVKLYSATFCCLQHLDCRTLIVVMGLLISLGVLPNFCDTVNDTSKL